MTTEVLDLPEMTAGQGQKEITYNEALRQIEAKLTRANERRSAEPASPANGEIYILTAAPSGTNWGGRSEHDIAHYYNNQWWFYVPKEGWRLWVMNEDVIYAFDGSTWATLGGGVDPTQDTTFTGTYLRLDRSTAGNADIRARGNASGAGIVTVEADNAFDVGIFRLRDYQSSNIWDFRMTGSGAGTRPDYLRLLYSPNDGSNVHEVFRAIPDQSTVNNDPTDIQFQGNLDIQRHKRFKRQAYFTTEGDMQVEEATLRAQTSNATPTEMFEDGASQRLSIAADSTWGFVAYITARRTDANDESAFYKLEGCIDRNINTTALVGTVTKTVIAEDNAAWDVSATADDTNDALVFTVTGEAAKTVRWNCTVMLVEITG